LKSYLLFSESGWNLRAKEERRRDKDKEEGTEINSVGRRAKNDEGWAREERRKREPSSGADR
jgi:hypothetical protein